MPTVADIRSQYPQYSDMSDADLAGALHSKFYSDMPADQFNAKIGMGQQQPAQAAAPQPNVLTDVAQSGATGLGEGVIGLAGMPGDIRSLASSATDKIGSMLGASQPSIDKFKSAVSSGASGNPITAPFALGPTSSQIQNNVEGVTGQFHQPQTVPGQYAHTIGQFAPAAVGGPESLLSRVATRVVAPAVASETAGQLTQGTAAEPFARIGGALAGAGGAASIANKITGASLEAAPTLDQLAAHKTALYQSPEIAAVQIKPAAMSNFSSGLDNTLLQNKVDKFVAPTVAGIVDRLQAPRFGSAGTVSDFDLARQSLSDVPPNEKRAAGIVRGAIDKYLGNIPQSDLLAGNAAAANKNLLEARATVAASKRSENITDALGRAENQAGSSYSGNNIENATRQQLRPILNQKQGVAKGNYFQDYTPEEIAALKPAVNGTAAGNVVRSIGKHLGGGGGSGAFVTALGSAAAAHEAGADPMTALMAGLGGAFIGRGFSALGNKMAVSRAAAVDNLLRMRSPLGAPIAARNAQVLGLMPSHTQQLSLPALLALQSQLQHSNSR